MKTILISMLTKYMSEGKLLELLKMVGSMIVESTKTEADDKLMEAVELIISDYQAGKFNTTVETTETTETVETAE